MKPWSLLAGAGVICVLAAGSVGASSPAGSPAPAVPANAAGVPGTAGPRTDTPGTAGLAEGEMPAHIPPMLFGRITGFTPGSSLAGSSQPGSFQIVRPGAPWGASGPLKVTLPTYASLFRIARIDVTDLHHGDSVLVQGRSGDDGTSFSAVRLIRSAKLIPLAPGVALADTAPDPVPGPDMAGAGEAAGGSRAAPTAPLTEASTAAPAAATLPGEKAATGQSAAKPEQPVVRQAVVNPSLKRIVRRAALPGRVVSANPLVVEIYDGSLWRVTLEPGAALLDQQPIQPTDLKAGFGVDLGADLREGALARVRGSETGPGAYRASELDLLAPGLTPQDLGAPAPRRARLPVRPVRRRGPFGPRSGFGRNQPPGNQPPGNQPPGNRP